MICTPKVRLFWGAYQNREYFSFGHSPNNTGCAQVRFLLACRPCNYYLLAVNGSRKKPSSERKVARECVTEGACATDGKSSLYRGKKISLRVLPQSPSATAPSRREPYRKTTCTNFLLACQPCNCYLLVVNAFHHKPRQIVKPSATLFSKNHLETKNQGIFVDDC